MLNYTTAITVEKTVIEIQGLLVRHQCRGVQMRYDEDGAITALAFDLPTEFGVCSYALPVNVDGVMVVLRQQKDAGRLPGLPWRVVEDQRALRAQAARVAWRVVKDWLQAQLALIEARVAPLEQIMLPFQVVGDDGATVYEVYRRQQAALPGA